MKTEQGQRFPSIIDQLIVVNKSAGQLRLVLLLLLFFIFWSIVAQTNLTQPAFLDIIIALLPEPTDFASDIFREILLTYLSPMTIFFTLIPTIIFLSIRKMIAYFFHVLFPDIKLKNIFCYLNNCAFSFPPRHYDISGQAKVNHQQSMQELSRLGGPAKISLCSGSIPIVSNKQCNTFSSYFPDSQSDKYDLFLAHGELIEIIATRDDVELFFDQISFKDGFERCVQLKNLGLKIGFICSSKKPITTAFQQISRSDALVFYNLKKNRKEIITSFLIDEVKTFFKFEPLITKLGGIPQSKKNRNRGGFPNLSINKLHKKYVRIIPNVHLANQQIARKHKHMLYTYLRKNGTEPGIQGKMQCEAEKVEHKLLLYLNDQLKSFFYTSNILISLIKIGEIKINGKNHFLQ